MGYNMRSTGLNVAIKVKLQFRGISFPYLGQTDRKSFIYLKKKKVRIGRIYSSSQ